MNLYLSRTQKEFYRSNGFVVIENIISKAELVLYHQIYNNFLSGKIEVGANRSDLGVGLGTAKDTENITQIMWPSKFMPELLGMAYHQRALSISRQLLGEDVAMDFDMMINKAPGTNTITPWHQDEAYWLNMPDKRAVSSWLALDHAVKENGCMWFVPGSNQKSVRPHRYASKEGGALTCDAQEDEGIAVELKPGSCTFHGGRTLHYSRGNSTDKHRRVLIVNFRPEKMIQLQRAKGFDHGRNDGGKRQLHNRAFKG